MVSPGGAGGRGGPSEELRLGPETDSSALPTHILSLQDSAVVVWVGRCGLALHTGTLAEALFSVPWALRFDCFP